MLKLPKIFIFILSFGLLFFICTSFTQAQGDDLPYGPMEQTRCTSVCDIRYERCVEVFTNQWYCVPNNMANYEEWLEGVKEGSIVINKPGLISITKIAPLIQNGIKLAFYLALILTMAFLIWGGIQWITSGGDKTKYEEARNKITAALVGLAIIALAYLLLRLAIHFLGLEDIFAGGFKIPTGYD